MSILSVPFLSRNRYTLTIAVLTCTFLGISASSTDSGFSACIVSQEFSNLWLDKGGNSVFGAIAKRAADLPGESAVIFEPNLGQADPAYSFVSSAGGVNMRLSSTEAMIEFPSHKGDKATAVHAMLAGARVVEAVGMAPLQSRTNYLIGSDRSRWLTGVANYGQVKFSGVYPGIDVVYHGSGNRLEHDFVVAPGADPSQIRMIFAGADGVTVTPDGALDMGLAGRKVNWLKPTLYQSDAKGKPSRIVEGCYKMGPDGTIRFEVGSYDRTKPLTIDPVLAYATYYGGSASESAMRVTVDANGNTYFTGGTTDNSFAVSNNAYKAGSALPDGDAIIVKMSADGKTVLYTTHFGGTAADLGLGIAVDASGSIYVAGLTYSPDFPITTGAIVSKIAVGPYGGNNRMCFVSKLNNAGTALQYSTFLGASDGDTLCAGIGVDSTGNAYVAGVTYANNFPTVNAIQPKYTSTGVMPGDGFVSKLSPDGTKLVYSTYLGGSGTTGVYALAVDAAGNAYVTGGTTSRDFPTTTSAYQKVYGGEGGQRIPLLATGDAFVTKMDSTGKLVYSTFLGGEKDDVGIGITFDAAGNVVVVGSTLSTKFPTASPYQAAYKGSDGDINYTSGDAFVAKLNPTGSALVFSTYFGGVKDDRAVGVGVDTSGNIFIAGNTFSTDFPITPDAKQATYGGESANDFYRTGDAFFAQFSPVGALVSSTYLGGSGTDYASGVVVDAQGAVVVVGGTDSSNLITTSGAIQTKFGGASGGYLPAGDAFVMKFNAAAVAAPSNSIAAVVNSASYAAGSVSPGEIVTVAGIGIGPDTLQTYQIVSSQFQTRVGNTRILFDGVPAPVIYVSGKQDAVVVPYSVAGKTQTIVTAEYNGLTSPGFPVPVSAVVPGLFSGDSTGSGQGAILNQDNSYNSSAIPAARGSIVLLYGTGEGQTTPGGIDGSIALNAFPKPLAPMSVIMAGQAVDPALVLYAGAAPSSIAGFFQVNVKIPCSVKAGNVPVVVQVGTVQSQKGLTVAVRDPTAAENYCPGQ